MKSKVLFSFILSFALVIGVFPAINFGVNAATLTTVSDIISDSRISTGANHEIKFVTPTGVESSTDTIILTFDGAEDEFDLGSIGVADIDLGEDNDGACDGAFTQKTLAGTAGAGTWGVTINTGDDTITFTAPTDASTGEIDAGFCVQILIGTNASGGSNQIVNPNNAGVETLSISGTFGDTGDTLIAVLSDNTASVSIDETLSVTVTGDDTETCPTVANTDVTASTTATTIPFGTTTGNSFIDGCQALTISTNAANGYSATIIMDDQLSFGATEIANGTCDGGCSDTVDAAWGTNTNNGLGYCLQNKTGSDMNTDFTGNACNDVTPNFKTIPDQEAADSPETIMSNTGAVSGNSVYITFRLSVPGNQAAGTYSNSIIYVATPTY